MGYNGPPPRVLSQRAQYILCDYCGSLSGPITANCRNCGAPAPKQLLPVRPPMPKPNKEKIWT